MRGSRLSAQSDKQWTIVAATRSARLVPLRVTVAVVVGWIGLSLGIASTPATTAAPYQTEAPSDADSPCHVSARAADNIQVECGHVVVSATANVACPTAPLFLVIVEPEQAPQAEWMNSTAKATLGVLASSGGVHQVGVVRYNRTETQVALAMTDDLVRAERVLGVPKRGSAWFDMQTYGEAADTALLLLRRSSDQWRRVDPTAEPVSVVAWFALAKAEWARDGQNMLDAGEFVKRSGAALLVGCPDTSKTFCHWTQQMPDAPEYYSEPQDTGAMADALHSIADASVVNLAALEWQEVLAPGLEYGAGSAQPAPVEVAQGQDGTRLIWRWVAPTTAQTVTYGTYAVQPGVWPVTTALVLTDTLGGVRTDVSTRAITTTEQCAVPTPTPPGTPTPEPTASPEAMGGRVYLPLALSEECLTAQEHVDVALVVDASLSMTEEVAPGLTKLAAAGEAVARFVELLAAEDQAALVWFNDSAVVEQPLTVDKGQVVQALGRIVPRQFTRIDLGLHEARLELESSRRGAGHRTFLIALTDGKANPVGPEAGVAEAALAKDAGVTVFTIGLGVIGDLDDEVLARIASTRAMYYRTPNPQELRSIYEQIARGLPCAAGRYWPGAG